MPVIAMLIVATPAVPVPSAAALGLPIAATATIVVMCIAAERGATRIGLGMLFRMPERWRVAITGDARHAAARDLLIQKDPSLAVPAGEGARVGAAGPARAPV